MDKYKKDVNKNRHKNRIIKALRAVAVILCSLSFTIPMTGCAALENTKVVFTTGFKENELFRIEDRSCTLSEFMVYLVNSQNTYESGFGRDIWNVSVGDEDMEGYVKDRCLSTISQVKAMNLLAKETGIELTESEISTANEAAGEYFSALNDDEKKAMGNIDEETLSMMYQEYALADKIYNYIIRDINPEISDDEARTITVEQIVLNTWKLDSKGNKILLEGSDKQEIKNKALQIQRQIREGTDFSVLMEQYNEAEEGTVSIGKGDMSAEIETAAFNLDNGEISGIIETPESFVILKCISTFNREETEANKIRIVEEKKREVFGEQYDAFASGLSRILNHGLYNKIHIDDSEDVKNSSFFDVYREYFGN